MWIKLGQPQNHSEITKLHNIYTFPVNYDLLCPSMLFMITVYIHLYIICDCGLCIHLYNVYYIYMYVFIIKHIPTYTHT